MIIIIMFITVAFIMDKKITYQICEWNKPDQSDQISWGEGEGEGEGEGANE